MPIQEDRKYAGFGAERSVGAGLSCSEALGESDARAVREGLAVGAMDGLASVGSIPIALRADGGDGSLAGALLGSLEHDWLWIDSIWVREPSRRQGVGCALLREAEAWARRRGAAGAALSAHDPQARSFFAGRGFQVFGVLGDNPRGRLRHFMRRQLG